MHDVGGPARIESVRIERTSPVQHFLMAFVSRIGHRRKILGVAADPADILGRTGAFSFQALRINRPRLRRRTAFEEHVMHPAVAEVVVILKGER
ncbi:MAG: hypothetical protein M5U12_04275 [Verrucomicrobia bacterium]|nr:hypothetical protein [Verrucomicrobiota bacterium]